MYVCIDMYFDDSKYIYHLPNSHTVGVICLVSVYAPTGVSEFAVKEAFYAQLQMVVDSCPNGDTLIVLGNFKDRPW